MPVEENKPVGDEYYNKLLEKLVRKPVTMTPESIFKMLCKFRGILQKHSRYYYQIRQGSVKIDEIPVVSELYNIETALRKAKDDISKAGQKDEILKRICEMEDINGQLICIHNTIAIENRIPVVDIMIARVD